MLADLQRADIGGNRPPIRGWNLTLVIRHGAVAFADHFKKVADGNIPQKNADSLALEAAGSIGNVIRRPSIATLDDLAVPGSVISVADGAKNLEALLAPLEQLEAERNRKRFDKFIWAVDSICFG